MVDENTTLSAKDLSHIGISPADAKHMVDDFLKKTGTPFAVRSMLLENDEQTGSYDMRSDPPSVMHIRLPVSGWWRCTLCARRGATFVMNDTQQAPQPTTKALAVFTTRALQSHGLMISGFHGKQGRHHFRRMECSAGDI